MLCVRITYLGELGYELYIPAEQAVHVYDRLVEAGASVGLRHAGLKALASLRMEKGYRDYGHDIDNTDSVLEAGLGFAVDLEKPGGFLGRDAVLAKKAAGPLTQAPGAGAAEGPRAADVPRRGGAPGRRRVGYIRAASYGFTLGGAVGLAMVDPAASRSTRPTSTPGSGRCRSATACYPARVSLRPLYDPANKRIRM